VIAASLALGLGGGLAAQASAAAAAGVSSEGESLARASATSTDDDGDGTDNETDPCTNTAPIDVIKPLVSIGKMTTPEADDTFKLSGRLTVFTTPVIDPLTNGLRFRFEDRHGNAVIDETVPGGLYNSALRVGWTQRGQSWTYRNAGTVPTVNGITSVTVRENPRVPGDLRFAIRAKRGSYPVSPEQIPLKLSIVVDPPFATTNQCGEVVFDAFRCRFASAYAKLTCR
jgi:hypothetical protein